MRRLSQQPYNESLDKVMLADVQFGRAEEVQSQREEIKRTFLPGDARSATHADAGGRLTLEADGVCPSSRGPIRPLLLP
jgi:hypothetical protein